MYDSDGKAAERNKMAVFLRRRRYYLETAKMKKKETCTVYVYALTCT